MESNWGQNGVKMDLKSKEKLVNFEVELDELTGSAGRADRCCDLLLYGAKRQRHGAILHLAADPGGFIGFRAGRFFCLFF